MSGVDSKSDLPVECPNFSVWPFADLAVEQVCCPRRAACDRSALPI